MSAKVVVPIGKKLGRPRSPADQPQFSMRMPRYMYDVLQDAAEENRRTLAGEIIYRLSKTIKK